MVFLSPTSCSRCNQIKAYVHCLWSHLPFKAVERFKLFSSVAVATNVACRTRQHDAAVGSGPHKNTSTADASDKKPAQLVRFINATLFHVDNAW